MMEGTIGQFVVDNGEVVLLFASMKIFDMIFGGMIGIILYKMYRKRKEKSK